MYRILKDMSEFLHIITSLFTLIILEIILGVDNLIFLTILSQRLPDPEQKQARRIGLVLAWVTRLLLLAFAVYLTTLVQPFFTIAGHAFSIRDLFLLSGGLFLIITASKELLSFIRRIDKKHTVSSSRGHFAGIVIQIALFDIIFSLDSVLTAIGLTQQFWIMALAITIAIGSMMVASEPLSAFIKRYPLVNILALVTLLLVGVMLMMHGAAIPH